MSQPTWDDAIAGRDEGMTHAEIGMGPEWAQEAFDYIVAYVKCHETLFSDDFWEWALPRGLTDPGTKGRAYGPQVRRAAAAGYIESTDEARPSVRSRTGLKKVWRSTIYEGPEEPPMPVLDPTHPSLQVKEPPPWTGDASFALDPHMPQGELIKDGRYQIWDPAKGAIVQMSRASGYADAIEDMYGLNRYKRRQAAKGLCRRDDLRELFLSTEDGDLKALDGILDDAERAADSDVKANRGTASHGFLARILAGEKVYVPESLQDDVTMMLDLLQRHGLRVLPEYIESVLVCAQLGVAGRCDLVVVNSDGETFIADFKTGGSLGYAKVKTSVQLAIYANAETTYDHATRTHALMPALRKDVGLVIHHPLGTDTCDLIEVDIASGWSYASELIPAVKASRNRNRREHDLFKIVPSPAPITADQLLPEAQLREWIKGRLVKLPAPAAAYMETLWPAGVPGFRSGHVHTDDELRRISRVLDHVEGEHEVPFGATEPAVLEAIETRTATFMEKLTGSEAFRRGQEAAKAELATATAMDDGGTVPPVVTAVATADEPDEGRTMDAGDLEALARQVAALSDGVRAVIGNWATEAHDAGCSFSIRALPSARRFEIYRALLNLAPYIEDTDLARATIASVIPVARRPSVQLGVVIGRLTKDQAMRLVDTARAVGTQSPALEYGEDGSVGWKWAAPPELPDASNVIHAAFGGSQTVSTQDVRF